MRMLIIDDSSTMRHFLIEIGQDLSFHTEAAADGLEALAVLEESDPFDVALIDWDMPRMDGIQLLNEVRRHPEFDSMKVVMVTAQTSYAAVCEALTKGADDYLMKPITSDMVADKLRIVGLLE